MVPPSSLPIYELREPLLAAADGTRRMVIEAPTGSGKSTQVPQMLVDHGVRGTVIVLQPRRLAARLLAARVARERNARLGGEVGYRVRFDTKCSSATRIVYETEGILLRQMVSDPELDGVGAILFDEFHERHLYADITLARARALQRGSRPDLVLGVMSATLDSGRLEDYLSPCTVLRSAGRTYPVRVDHLPHKPRAGTPIWATACEAVERLLTEEAEGDVLVFMPGAYEIRRTVEALQASPACRDVAVLPLHGELPPDQQDAAVERGPGRRVVVSTNVAETSLTIEGVRMVVDGGLARVARFDVHRGINTLLVEPISRASAEQRAGRAGRTAPGRCLRLWTEREHAARKKQELPELHRVELSEVLLSLKAAGFLHPSEFPWFEAPAPEALEKAETLLHDLGAIAGEKGAITETGKAMLSFPLHPRYARMLLGAAEKDCVRQVALVAALSQGRPLLVRTREKAVLSRREELLGDESDSDFFRLTRAWQYAKTRRYQLDACRELGIHASASRQVEPLFQQFLRIARQQGLPVENPVSDPDDIRRCILLGFSDQVALRRDRGTLRCELVHGRRGELARESAVRNADLMVASEITEIDSPRGDISVRLNLVTAIEEGWLEELYPDDMVQGERTVYDENLRRVVGREERRFRDLVLHEKTTEKVSLDAAAALLAEQVAAGTLKLKRWDAAVEKWIQRVNFLHRACPEVEMPAIGDDERREMLEQVCYGATAYKQIKDRDPWPTLKAWLNPAHLALLDRYAPARITLPGGRQVKVAYPDHETPFLAATIQDLYGLKQGLTLAGGAVKPLIHVLAPNRRPVQVTDDLTTFWKETYPEVKAELSRRYPKHEWR